MNDKTYCSSAFLMYRTIPDHSKQFQEGVSPKFFVPFSEPPTQVHDSFDLEDSLKKSVERACKKGKTAIALSGGIDSAILAKFMPKGSVAYTFKCVVPGIEVTDETIQAAKYAKECGLEHRIVEIYWEDFERYIPILIEHKGAPCHSIEVQIYKAGLQAVKDGHDTIIYGESSDVHYGGLSGLLSKDWTVGEFIDRYSYVKPYHALKEYQLVTEPITKYEENGWVNVHEFNRHELFVEAMGSYTNACETAGINVECPYARTWLADPIDLNRVRAGENKYIVRELFNRLYPGYVAPPKTPMPRPVDQWFKDWEGPKRPEFWPHCTKYMNGDQRYYVWVLEKFLDYLDTQK